MALFLFLLIPPLTNADYQTEGEGSSFAKDLSVLLALFYATGTYASAIFSGHQVFFKIIPFLFIALLLIERKSGSMWLILYLTFFLMGMSVMQNLCRFPDGGYIFLPNLFLIMLVLAIAWLLYFFTMDHPPTRPRFNWRTIWLWPIALLSFWYPMDLNMKFTSWLHPLFGNFFKSLMDPEYLPYFTPEEIFNKSFHVSEGFFPELFSDPSGLMFTMIMPLFLCIIVSFLPTFNRGLLRLTSFAGLLFAVYFIGGGYMGYKTQNDTTPIRIALVHVPLLIVSAYVFAGTFFRRKQERQP